MCNVIFGRALNYTSASLYSRNEILHCVPFSMTTSWYVSF